MNSYVEIDGEEIPVIVKYTYRKATRGLRGEYGVPMDPDEPSHVEIHSVNRDGEDISEQLGESIMDRIRFECLADSGEDGGNMGDP